jgi:enoyl-CoA hydratase/carnithine racemase
MNMTPARDAEFETLSVTQDGRVLTAMFADPPYNFMTARLQRDLEILTRAVDADESVGAVVFTGGLEDRYVTHFDIGEILAAADAAGRPIPQCAIRASIRAIGAAAAIPGAEDTIEATPLGGILKVTRFHDVVLRILRSPAVYIAAINGPCGGGGVETSVFFDVRLIADEGAGCLLPELLIGLTTTIGGQRLAQLMGPARSLEMMLEGRMYTPQECLEIGLVNKVVPRADLLTAAQELGARYARRNRANVAAQKRIFNEQALLAPAEALRREGAANAAGVLAGPARAALRAWIESQDEGGGDSVFLTNPDPWVDGEVIDMNP